MDGVLLMRVLSQEKPLSKMGIAWARYQLGLTDGVSNDFCDDYEEEIPEARKKL